MMKISTEASATATHEALERRRKRERRWKRRLGSEPNPALS
ncbi:hypothetical protein [Mesorhizobium sp. M0488]